MLKSQTPCKLYALRNVHNKVSYQHRQEVSRECLTYDNESSHSDELNAEMFSCTQCPTIESLSDSGCYHFSLIPDLKFLLSGNNCTQCNEKAVSNSTN